MLEIIRAQEWIETVQDIDFKVNKRSAYEQHAMDMYKVINQLIDKGEKINLAMLANKLNNLGHETATGKRFTYANLKGVLKRINKLTGEKLW